MVYFDHQKICSLLLLSTTMLFLVNRVNADEAECGTKDDDLLCVNKCQCQCDFVGAQVNCGVGLPGCDITQSDKCLDICNCGVPNTHPCTGCDPGGQKSNLWFSHFFKKKKVSLVLTLNLFLEESSFLNRKHQRQSMKVLGHEKRGVLIKCKPSFFQFFNVSRPSTPVFRSILSLLFELQDFWIDCKILPI